MTQPLIACRHLRGVGDTSLPRALKWRVFCKKRLVNAYRIRLEETVEIACGHAKDVDRIHQSTNIEDSKCKIALQTFKNVGGMKSPEGFHGGKHFARIHNTQCI